MPKIPIQIRVEKDELEKWQREAQGNLSAWIRRKCNDMDHIGVIGSAVPSGGSRSNSGIADSVAVGKKAKLTCKHGIEKGWRCWQCGGSAIIGG